MLKFILPFALLVSILFSCGTASQVQNISSNSSLNLQFDTTHPFLFAKEKCEAIWDKSSSSIFISGTLLNDKGMGPVDQLNILIQGINLEEIEFPYELDFKKNEHATVAWYNEQEVALERNLCIDDDCEFRGDLKDIKFVLTGFNNGLLSGYFDGRIYLKGTGKVQFTKTSAFKEICKASFRLNLTSERITNNDFVASINK